MLVLSWIGFFILWWGCSHLISKMRSTSQTSNKTLTIGGGFILSFVVLLVGIKIFESKPSDTSSSANQPQSVPMPDQKLNLVTKFLVEKHGFVENIEYTKKYGASLNSRRLSFQSGNCMITANIAISATKKLEISEELEVLNESVNVNKCMTSNGDIAERYLILVVNLTKVTSDQELMPLLLKSISLTELRKDAQEIIPINGKQFALDYQNGKKITWMLTTEMPDILK